ncbi:hypothetical protein Bca4012_057262 [Brassica carinata]
MKMSLVHIPVLKVSSSRPLNKCCSWFGFSRLFLGGSDEVFMVWCCHLEHEVQMRSLLFVTNIACSLAQFVVRSPASHRHLSLCYVIY